MTAILTPRARQTLLDNRTRAHGAAGAAWVERLPEIIALVAEAWGLDVESPFENLSYNYVAPVRLATGEPAVLKVCYPDPEGDFYHEERCLREFAEGTSIRLFDSDLELCALLLERLDPGTMLSELDDDVEATAIAASVMQDLWRLPPDDYVFPQAWQWIEDACSPAAIPVRKQQLPWAQAILEQTAELSREVKQPLLLHGDLHHYNILAAQRQPWLAIDPHGVIGDPAWELAPFLINNLERFATKDWPRIVRRRADQLIESLSLDRQAAYAWNATRALQCAFWSLRDETKTWDAAVICAEEMAKGP